VNTGGSLYEHDLYVVELDQQGAWHQRRLGPAPHLGQFDSVVGWSLDGEWIVFRGMREGQGRGLHAIRADGSELRTILDSNVDGVKPAW
jgi:hypothetical protein